jgi:hypothetical protein
MYSVNITVLMEAPFFGLVLHHLLEFRMFEITSSETYGLIKPEKPIFTSDRHSHHDTRN